MELLQEAWPLVFLTLLALCGSVGMLAMVSPKLFAVVAETGGLRVIKPKNSLLFESAIDIDQFVMRHSRQFGVVVTLVVAFLALCSLGHVDPSWTPNFLLFIVGLSVCLASAGLIELGGKVSKIEQQLAEARVDMLTGLANRRALEEELERRLSEKARKGTNLSVSILDIDKFKEINDQHGHLAGDTVLAQGVAAAIRNTKRTMDLAARYGGDEFVILYPDCKLAQAAISVNRLRTEIAAQRLPVEDAELAIHVSIGVAEATDEDDVDSFLARADKALYAAKQSGRNRVFQHDGDTCQMVEIAETEPQSV